MTMGAVAGDAVADRAAARTLDDAYGRTAVDLRVSLTDKCNLRCTYCMPAEGLEWLAGPDLLTDDEIVRLIEIGVRHLGIREVRFTGGEPLIRPGLRAIVAATAAMRPRPSISMTTNGIGLTKLAGPLVEAGLDRINVSLDTLDPIRFAQITRRDRHAAVIEGLAAAVDAGLGPVKINAVLLRGVNDDEAVPLLRFALDHGYELRFIEQMPLDAGHVWTRDGMVTADEILTRLRTAYDLRPDPAHRGAAPAETWIVDDGSGSARQGDAKVGVIASVTRPFCGDCDRTRLTADGQVRSCLFSRDESDLRGALRDGRTDEEIADRWRIAMATKLPGHAINDPSFLQPTRPMSAIGG